MPSARPSSAASRSQRLQVLVIGVGRGDLRSRAGEEAREEARPAAEVQDALAVQRAGGEARRHELPLHPAIGPLTRRAAIGRELLVGPPAVEVAAPQRPRHVLAHPLVHVALVDAVQRVLARAQRRGVGHLVLNGERQVDAPAPARPPGRSAPRRPASPPDPAPSGRRAGRRQTAARSRRARRTSHPRTASRSASESPPRSAASSSTNAASPSAQVRSSGLPARISPGAWTSSSVSGSVVSAPLTPALRRPRSRSPGRARRRRRGRAAAARRGRPRAPLSCSRSLRYSSRITPAPSKMWWLGLSSSLP